MKTLKQDSNNDISIGADGQFAFVEGIDAYKTIIEDAVRTQRGEIQSDTSIGIPYMATVFSDQTSIPLWKDRVKSALLAYDFVLSISNFDVKVNYVTKVMSYSMTITTTAGDVEIKS